MAYKRFSSVKEWAAAQGVRGRSATLAALWAEHRRLMETVDYLEKEDMIFIKRERDRLDKEVKNLRNLMDTQALKLKDYSNSLNCRAAELREASTDSIKAEGDAIRKRDDSDVTTVRLMYDPYGFGYRKKF